MTIRTVQEQMADNVLVKHYAGSRAYGTSLPTSDTDFRGIFVADPIFVRTPFYSIKEVEDTSEEDTKSYELAQFMKLALDCNPNVIETLWVDQSSIVTTSPGYELLRENRHALLSSKIAFTTSGYALSQLKRIKGHGKWLTQAAAGVEHLDHLLATDKVNTEWVERHFESSVVAQLKNSNSLSFVTASQMDLHLTDNNVGLLTTLAPRQCNYVSLVHNFTSDKILKVNLVDYEFNHRLVPFSGDTYGVYQADSYSPFNAVTGNLNADFDGDRQTLGVPLLIVKFNRETYTAALEGWKNYWTWKKNRNSVRSTLEEQFGYDTKHAMHLVRLLRMGKEALLTGEINVLRPDAAELLEIRAGAWSYEEVVSYAEMLDNEVRTVLYPVSKLPKRPNIELAATLVMQVQDMMWNR